ncbi:hypothetical protein [Candidatus Albibeggiatoa sp. nov. NOAA]|uniref:hypothetical protein n=1 Tax=Candidatus Albibeggiatoa sp. nov. NOAA TaxID=3162724 RepID=UPI0032FDE00A|nr:hypothetical protein [Thiotrichaceae bacterium]
MTISDWVALIGAMTIFDWVALIGAGAWSPHLIGIVKDFFSKPTITIFMGNTEIGFAPHFGAMINLHMAFSVENKDITISGVNIKLMHEDREIKILKWHRISQSIMQTSNTMTGDLVPFVKEYAVLAMKLNTMGVEEKLIKFQDTQYFQRREKLESKAWKQLEYLREVEQFEFEQFLDSQEMLKLYSFVEQASSWKQGKYTAVVEIDSLEDFNINNNQYTFELSLQDIKKMEQNMALVKDFYKQRVAAKELDENPKIRSNNELKEKYNKLQQRLNWNWLNPVFVPLSSNTNHKKNKFYDFRSWIKKD